MWFFTIQNHIRPKRLDLRKYWNVYFDLTPLSFERAPDKSIRGQARKLGKENSPAGEKLPKILSQWQQKFQLLLRQKSAADVVRQEIFAFAITRNF